MERIKRHILALLIPLFLLAGTDVLFGQNKLDLDVKDKKIRKEKLQKLNKSVFQNRSNILADEETRKQEIEVGKKLANLLDGDPSKGHTYRGITAYRYQTGEETKFGADILDLGPDAKFGHINAIVRTVTGYLNASFEYNMEDSELLAMYIVYYNLKHKNNINYLNKYYSNNVIGTLKKEKVGIPKSFEGWNGQSQLVVPSERNVLKGKGLDIAVYELEDQVNPDIDIQSKSKMDRLQKRKLKGEKEELQARIDALDKREKELLDKRADIEKKLEELYKDPIKNKAEIAKLEAEKKRLDDLIAQVQKEKKDAKDKMEQLVRREEMRRLGFTSEREYLAYLASLKKPEPKKEEPKKEEPKPEPVKEVVIPAPKPIPGNYTSYIQTNKGGISAREFIYTEHGIVVIGFKADVPEKELALFLVSSAEFEFKRSSEGIKLSPNTPVVYAEGKLFVIELVKDKAYLTQFNNAVEFENRSEIEVNPDSSIYVKGDLIYLTTTSGYKKILKLKDLSEVKQ